MNDQDSNRMADHNGRRARPRPEPVIAVAVPGDAIPTHQCPACAAVGRHKVIKSNPDNNTRHIRCQKCGRDYIFSPMTIRLVQPRGERG